MRLWPDGPDWDSSNLAAWQTGLRVTFACHYAKQRTIDCNRSTQQRRIGHLVSCHWRVGVAILCKPVCYEKISLLQLDQDPLDSSRREDPRYYLCRVAASRIAYYD